MNKKLILMIAVLLGAAIFFVLKDKSTPEVSHHETHQEDDHHDHDGHQANQNHSTTPEAVKMSQASDVPKLSKGVAGKIDKTQFVPSTKEEESLHAMNQKLAVVFEHKEEPQELISFFEQERLAPEMTVDSNEYTGTMLMIRTQKSLPGTRYYHAQYMGDDKDHTFLQHMSYEFKPGPESLNKAIRSAESTFNLSNKRIHRDGDFITYDIGDEGTHELSIEKAKWETLKNDPFNAHSEEDEGTIITRIELKIHSDDGEDHTHHAIE